MVDDIKCIVNSSVHANLAEVNLVDNVLWQSVTYSDILQSDITTILCCQRVCLIVIAHDVGIRCIRIVVGVRIGLAPGVADTARCRIGIERAEWNRPGIDATINEAVG